jgi:mannose/cellobiose epimerase-like protein (N-acyl-D-glucosamine 2-epimerase family)
MATIEEINRKIALLEARIAKYDDDLDNATSEERKDKIRDLITASRADLTQLRIKESVLEEANRGGN